VIQSIVKNVADWQASQSNEISLVPDNLTDSFVCDVRKINEGIACYSISAMCRSNTNRPLKNVFEAADARQKQAKKRSIA